MERNGITAENRLILPLTHYEYEANQRYKSEDKRNNRDYLTDGLVFRPTIIRVG